MYNSYFVYAHNETLLFNIKTFKYHDLNMKIYLKFEF